MFENSEDALKTLSSEKVIEILSNVFGSRFTDLLEDEDLKFELTELGYIEDHNEEDE